MMQARFFVSGSYRGGRFWEIRQGLSWCDMLRVVRGERRRGRSYEVTVVRQVRSRSGRWGKTRRKTFYLEEVAAC